jgi:hypothetical protein
LLVLQELPGLPTFPTSIDRMGHAAAEAQQRSCAAPLIRAATTAAML